MGTTATWQAAYRERHPDYVIRQKDQARARYRALVQLKHNHQEEFEELFADALDLIITAEEEIVRGRSAVIGDTMVSANGYHYTRTEDKWRLTHHIIAEEKILGRPLLPSESVRFKDPSNKANLHPDNLVVVTKGTASLKKRRAQLETRLDELKAQIADLDKQIAAQEATSKV